MTAVALSFPSLDFEDFLARYLEDGQYELIDGELIDLEPTGLHEQVAGFLNRQLNGAIDRRRLPWLVPMKCLLRPSGLKTAFRPDLAVLDLTVLGDEPLWRSQPVITLGKSVKLAVEVVSTNWQNDYARKVEDYEAMGIAEYWIVDYLGLGGKRYIGWPKAPVITVYRLRDGAYEGRQFRGSEILVSEVFPDLELKADRVFAAGSIAV